MPSLPLLRPVPPSLAIPSLRFLSRFSSNTSQADLLLRFFDLLKRFPQENPSAPNLSPDSRPPWLDPYEYNRLMSAFASAGDSTNALRLFDEMKRFHCRPDAACYTTVANALISSDQTEAAIAVSKEMVSSGVPLDTMACTVLVKLYACHLRQFEAAYEVLDRMRECGCKPDVITYSTLILGLCQAGRVTEARGVLGLMSDEGCEPNVHTYTPILNAYCVAGQVKEVEILVSTMEATNCVPNVVVYNILINALCKAGRLNEVERILANCKLKGWEPDVITYGTYMDGLCKAGKVGRSFKLFEEMVSHGLYPNKVIINILLDGLCKRLNGRHARSVLDSRSEYEWQPDVVNYNTVMNWLCEAGEYISVLKLFTDMLKKGVEPDSWTFSILVQSLCKGGKIRVAKCLFESNGFLANEVSYNTLVRYLYFSGEVKDAYCLFHKRAEGSIVPNHATYGIMIELLCKEGRFSGAIDCFFRSLKNGFQSNVVVKLVRGLVEGERIYDLVIFLEWIVRKGFFIDASIYSSLIRAFCFRGSCQNVEIQTLCYILEKLLRNESL
ncbi:Pentatricopeptide repeat-containing protein [Rhynchospora pubera]|uniref:Pentatricopeptide repeat-containing protein n=1 Tax=Rhynchospora pubera TaxID=906938 RepID=A0AAV8GIT0_9POAL|nr:Pentatricopeptide repeat-containing protein [Rhynchospora pubera]